jgi:hypothetical protein
LRCRLRRRFPITHISRLIAPESKSAFSAKSD